MEAVDPRAWKLPLRQVATFQSADPTVLWNTAKLGYEHQLFGQCTSMYYSPCGSYFAATATNHQLLLRLPATVGSVWNEQIARKAFTCRFRDDSKMVVQCVDTRVTVRSTETAFERHFDGHTRDVRDAVFLSKHMFASASDDSTLRFWQVTSDTELGVSDAHGDYVRSLDCLSEHVVMSGGYDKVVRLWDVRVRLDADVAALPVGKPVEKVLFIPQRNLGVAAAGDVVSLFDLRVIGSKKSHTDLQALKTLSIHSKTVSGLAYSPSHDTLVTSGFDGRVKFVSLRDGADYAVDAVKNFDHPVTSVAVHPDGNQFAVGSAVGGVSLFSVKAAVRTTAAVLKTTQREAEVITDRLGQVRKLLSAYQYHRALRVAFFSQHADVITSTLEELQRRCVLHVALSGHNDRAITQVLRFAVQHIDDPELHRICAATLDVVFEIYGPAASQSPFFHRELLRAHKRLGDSVARLEPIRQSLGMLEMALDNYE
jgi:U3 small nucleolar RNA-associated protein 15